MNVSDAPLTEAETDQVFANVLRAWDHLQLAEGTAEADAVAAVRDFVDQVRPSFGALKPNVRHNMAVRMGALWGQMLCNAAGWEWCGLSIGGAEGTLAVVSPDRSFAMVPVGFIGDQLERRPLAPGADNTVLLLFNMIMAGRLPKSKPGQYLVLG